MSQHKSYLRQRCKSITSPKTGADIRINHIPSLDFKHVLGCFLPVLSRLFRDQGMLLLLSFLVLCGHFLNMSSVTEHKGWHRFFLSQIPTVKIRHFLYSSQVGKFDGNKLRTHNFWRDNHTS